MVRASCTALLECMGRKPWNTRKETQLELLNSWRPTTVRVALGLGGKVECRTGLGITLVQLPLMLITSAWSRGKKGNGCFEKRGVEGGRVCNITRLAILGLTTGHRYRRLLVTTIYLYAAVAPSPISWSDSSSVWEAMAVWHDGQCWPSHPSPCPAHGVTLL